MSEDRNAAIHHRLLSRFANWVSSDLGEPCATCGTPTLGKDNGERCCLLCYRKKCERWRQKYPPHDYWEVVANAE